MRWLLTLPLLILCTAAPAWSAPAPLPVRALVRQPLEPFPGEGEVPAYRLRAGAPGCAIRPGDLDRDPATEVGPAVQGIVLEVGDDPRAAYRWVRERVEYEPYHGVKRGAEGVGSGRAGNDFDQAALLASVLRTQGVPCRFVYGVVRLAARSFCEWYGVATAEEGYRLAVRGGTPIRAVRVGGRIVALEVSHCWLEAHLPYFSPGYRGTGERTWVALDPSYKKHEVTLGIDLFPRLGLQEESLFADYLSTPRDVSPEQYFRDLLRGALSGIGPAGSLSLALYQVAVAPAGPVDLPCDLSPDLEVLGIVWERSAVPEIYYYRLRLTLWDSVDDGRGVTRGDLRVEFPTAFLARRNLTLAYRPAGPEDQALAETSPTRSPLDPTIRGQIRLRPVLLVDGRPVGEVLPGELTEAAPPGPAQGGNIGTPQTLLIETIGSGRDPDPVNRPPGLGEAQFGCSLERLLVGETYAFGSAMGTVSADELGQRVDALRALQREESPEKVLCSILSLATLEYLHRTGAAARRFAQLLGVRYLQEPSLIMCGVHLAAGDPFFHVIGLVSAVVSRDGRADRERAFLCLWGMESSFQEHKVLEDVFQTTAVSTMRILKHARELGIQPLLIDSSNVDTEAGRILFLGTEGEWIRTQVREGKKVLLSPETFVLERWIGTGYVVWDPATWCGSYRINGGLAGGSCSGRIPSFLLGLWQSQATGSRFTVVHTVRIDPELPGEMTVDVVLIDLTAATTPILAAVLVLPDSFPLDRWAPTAGQPWGTFRVLPSLFVVDEATTLRAAGLWVDPSTPGEAFLRWAVLAQSDDLGQGFPVTRVLWTRWDGSSWGQATEAPTVIRGPPPAGMRERLRADVTSIRGDARTGYGSLLGLWTPEDLGRVVPLADDQAVLFHGPPDDTGSTRYSPNEEGEVRIPYDELASWSLDDDYVTLGIVAGGKVIGYDLGSLRQPGTCLLLYADKAGVARQVILRVGGIDLALDADNDNGFGTEFDAEDDLSSDEPGKIIALATGDADADGIPDFADGFDGDGQPSGDDVSAHRLVPVLVTLDIGPFQTERIDRCTIRFLFGTEAQTRYPAEQVRVGELGDVPRYTLVNPTPIRLWTTDATVPRTATPLPAKGDPGAGAYVDPNGSHGRHVAPYTRYPLSTFFRSDPGAPHSRLFYMEGLVASEIPAEASIAVELNIDGEPAPPAAATTPSIVAPGSTAVPVAPQARPSEEQERRRTTVTGVELVPDFDRDGTIGDADRNRVTAEQPWRFWINDDRDAKADPATGIASGSVDLPAETSLDAGDHSDRWINGVRDLVDFFPLYLDLRRALKMCPPRGAGYVYRLQQADSAVSVFHQAAGERAENTLTTATSRAYLTDLDVTDELKGRPVQVVTPAGVVLPADFLSRIAASPLTRGEGIVLLEGRKASTKPLVLAIQKNGALIASFEFPLDIAGVKEMFGQKDLRGVAGGTGGGGDRHLSTPPPKTPFCLQGVDKTLIWLHGYYVDGDAATATYAEVFKRLFHSGFRGRFYGVSWFGDPPDSVPLLPPPHYHQAVVNAFATAKPFADFVRARPGEIHLVAHSLGNIVVGSALQDHGLTNFAKYFAVDSSVALEAYGQIANPEDLVRSDGSLNPAEPSACMVNVEGWPDGGSWPRYVAGGQSRLLPSEWYKLFAAPDNRRELTWRNRLSRVPSAKVYNFYSSTEEVLRSYANDAVLFDGSGPLRIYSWVKQEKFKGRRTMGLAVNVGGVSSTYCGWKFSFAWRRKDDNGAVRWPTPAEAAVEIDRPGGIDLREKPFFELDNRLYVSDGSVIPQRPHLVNLVQELGGVSPSEFVIKKISETDLKDYYTDNRPAHPLVVVKDWLLAEAFPATTLPAGANRNKRLTREDQNIDMSKKEPDGCMTNPDRWPREESRFQAPWYHSDYKDVPFQHTHTFFGKISTLIGG